MYVIDIVTQLFELFPHYSFILRAFIKKIQAVNPKAIPTIGNPLTVIKIFNNVNKYPITVNSNFFCIIIFKWRAATSQLPKIYNF